MGVWPAELVVNGDQLASYAGLQQGLRSGVILSDTVSVESQGRIEDEGRHEISLPSWSIGLGDFLNGRLHLHYSF